jgi:polyisoprenoid-binding protein YceI
MSTAIQHTSTTTTLPAGTWRVDPVLSTVGFEVRDMTNLVGTVHGRFTDYEAALDITPAGASASAVIRVASLTTDHADRDDDLRSEQFLDCAAHAEIRFASDSIELAEEGRISLRGRLELKGAEHPVQLDGAVLGVGRDHQEAERLAIAVRGPFPFGPMLVDLFLDVSATSGR